MHTDVARSVDALLAGRTSGHAAAPPHGLLRFFALRAPPLTQGDPWPWHLVRWGQRAGWRPAAGQWMEDLLKPSRC